RHCIIVGAPGIGKTTLAKEVAALLPPITVNDCGFCCIPKQEQCPICKQAIEKKKTIPTVTLKGQERFVRIQGSSDLAIEDLLGSIDPIKALTYGPYSLEAFTPGIIFRANYGILFFDEINRSPEKVQNALLQVLEEHEASIGNYKVVLPAKFILIATMNPEDSSTERLSDVFIDRFDVINMDYPQTVEQELAILKTKNEV
ncbi:MAG: AAA family ATPase, partial [Candidatus Woesearchaeota archaeon]